MTSGHRPEHIIIMCTYQRALHNVVFQLWDPEFYIIIYENFILGHTGV
jgi:hypothetical protein